MKNVSAIIIAKNESHHIKDALSSVSFAKEIIVIDDGSTDDTVKIARQFKADVIVNPLNNNFARQRNFAMKQARYDWVLFLDADERISNKLRYEILELPDDSKESAYMMRRTDFFWGKQLRHGETGSSKVARLVHKDRGSFVRRVHEEWKSNEPVSTLKNHLHHYPHPTLKEFLEEVNYYSTLNADHFYHQHVRTNIFDIMLRPIAKFCYTYFIKQGFLDGAEGFVYSFMMAFHSYLTRTKLYLLQNK